MIKYQLCIVSKRKKLWTMRVIESVPDFLSRCSPLIKDVNVQAWFHPKPLIPYDSSVSPKADHRVHYIFWMRWHGLWRICLLSVPDRGYVCFLFWIICRFNTLSLVLQKKIRMWNPNKSVAQTRVSAGVSTARKISSFVFVDWYWYARSLFVPLMTWLTHDMTDAIEDNSIYIF